jgi:hypothetical protein
VTADLDISSKMTLVRRTGQKHCFDEEGTEIECAGTGQDGELQKGLPCFFTTCFVDNGDGTVDDLLTGLVWLQDRRCLGSETWSEALAAANTLDRRQLLLPVDAHYFCRSGSPLVLDLFNRPKVTGGDR